jgi:hypothetical protein
MNNLEFTATGVILLFLAITRRNSTNAPLSLILSKNYNTLTLTHEGKSYEGACR